ncbi:proteasome stabiliser ECM29 [Scenedesmus sp. NREL 46B-D3]|nr:proteasome stabiliser ECM29 [Scenedesmus sp. NREL 46B-D3]
MASEDEEVAALDRVLTRTVLTKDEDLQQLLAKLLPALVQKMATGQPKTRAKVLELLSHINKRVKALPACSLPLLPLLQLAMGNGSSSSSPASPMVASFALVYVEMGQPRAPADEQLQAVPLLLSGVARRPKQHRVVALRVATAALSHLQQAPGGSYSQVVAVTSTTSSSASSSGSSSSSSRAVSAVSLLPTSPEDRALLLSHALKVMLYQRPSSGNMAPPTPLGLANAAAANNAPAAALAAAPPPPGLSSADVALLEEKGVPSQEQLVKLKLGLLGLLGGAAAGMPGNASAAAAGAAGSSRASPSSKAGASAGSSGAGAGSAAASMDVDTQQGQAAAVAAAGAPAAYLSSEELLLVLLAASCDPYEAVARRGADLLQKLVNPDAARPAVDLEGQALVDGLVALLLGDQDPRAPKPAATPAGPALSQRIMQLLVRSFTAAQSFPAAPLVLTACMYGPAASPRLLRLGAEWAAWMFKHAPAHQLRAMAGPLLQRLLAALGLQAADGGEGDAMQVDGAPPAAGGSVVGLAGSSEARGHVFSALAQLTQRLPDLFQSDTTLASRLFAALGAEPPGSRTALQEALGGLAAAMGAGIQATAGAAGTAAATAASAAAAGSGDLPASKVEELEKLLLSSIGSDQAAVRLCAAQWANKLFLGATCPAGMCACLLLVTPSLR